MDVIILAAGYATRLYPLTENRAKPLLPVGDKPIIDHLMDRVNTLDGVRGVHVVTNQKFYDSFVEWQEQRPEGHLWVHNDKTTSNDDRLGAIGDVNYVIDNCDLRGELLVVAGDNLFEFDLAASQRFFRAHGTTAHLYEFPDPELVPEYSEARLNESGQLVFFKEKPPNPKTNLIGICCYFFSPEDVGRFAQYLKLFPRTGGKSFDAPGYYLEWLHLQTQVYGFPFEGLWFDIGDLGSLTLADNLFRQRLGWPTRERYEL